jgi:O-antigen/teichoic acid export membrane protein
MLNKVKLFEQRLSPGLRKIVRNMSWLVAERIVNMVLSLFVGLYVVRYLGAESYGKLSYGASFAGLFGAIATLGLNQIVIRNIVREESSTQQTLGTAFVLRCCGSLLAIALITIAICIFSQDIQTRWITAIVACGFLLESFEVVDFWFQSQVLSRPMAMVRSFQLTVSAIAKIALIFLHLPLIAFVWLMLADSIVKAVGTIWVYSQHKQSIFKWKFNWSIATSLLKDSWPMILSSLMIMIYMRIDQVMLGNMANNEEVGNYAAAVRFSEIWYFMPTAICSSVLPSIVRAKQRSDKEYYEKLQQLYDLLAWLSLIVAIVITFSSNSITTLFLGSEYQKAGTILALLIWTGPFVFLGVALTHWLTVENFTRFSFATTSLGAVSNIIFNFWLIPVYGGIGAAIATLISYAIPCYLAFIFYPPMFRTGWMVTKALLIPFRFKQNIRYLNYFRNKIFIK